ncbi:MAG TPA: hypothetical protein VI521_00195, partial [Candidatus Babeliales bacterium]|nr:hypothetical protein [Candidatus Babeliales bacterium]
MKHYCGYKRVILLILLTILPSKVSCFNDLMRDYYQFEQLIAGDNLNIYLNPIDQRDAALAATATRSPKKKWTFIVYMAADNDLRAFAANNIRQMAAIGSNENINILTHLDIRLNGNQKVTRRYYIEKNKLNQMNN